MIRSILLRPVALFLFLTLTACNDKNDQASGTDTQDLRLLTYNVWYGFTEVPARKARWLEWMRAQAPDIVFLQELNEYTPEQLQADAASWGHSYSALLKEEGFPTGITSRYPIEDVQRYLDGFHHGLMRARIQGMYVYNIHLHPGNWEVRNREIERILADIDGLPEDAPVVLAGDFNTFSPYDSVYYAHGELEPFFQGLDGGRNLKEGRLDYGALQRLLDAGLIDLEYRLRGDDYRFTGSFPTLIEKEGEHGSLRRLDYVFVNEALLAAVRRAAVIADDTTQYLSDHLPVVVDLRLAQ